MIDIIITSYNEPKSTLRAINCLLKQQISQEFRIIVSDPFLAVKEFLKENIKDRRVGFFLDPGEGKPYALNLLFKEIYTNNKSDIIILTDGDVFVSDNSISEILNKFKDPEIGCVTGKPVSLDSRDKKYGYWSKLLYGGIDKVRKKLSIQKRFMQCSGYLFAIRNGIIKEIPVDVPEDCIIPYLIWKEGYRVDYSDKAEVYIKYPNSWKDWISQKIRTIKAHENLDKFCPDMPRTKSLWSEIKEGTLFALAFPKTLKEFFWTIQLFLARLYVYHKSFREMKKQKAFDPGWRELEIQSTKPLD